MYTAFHGLTVFTGVIAFSGALYLYAFELQSGVLSWSLKDLLSISWWVGLPGQVVSFRLSWNVSISPSFVRKLWCVWNAWWTVFFC